MSLFNTILRFCGQQLRPTYMQGRVLIALLFILFIESDPNPFWTILFFIYRNYMLYEMIEVKERWAKGVFTWYWVEFNSGTKLNISYRVYLEVVVPEWHEGSCEPSLLQSILEQCCLSTRMSYPFQSSRPLISYWHETSYLSYHYRMWSE